MITIIKGTDTRYCNACFDGVAVIEIILRMKGSNHSHSFSLCKDCLAELADISVQASRALLAENAEPTK
jgi:hypothetical protein